MERVLTMAGADDPTTTTATPAAPTTPPAPTVKKRKNRKTDARRAPRICARVNIFEMVDTKKHPENAGKSACRCDHWEIRKPGESYGDSYGMGNLCRRDYGIPPFKKVETGALKKKDPLPKKKR
jgi:hypothetical protein